MSTNSSPTQADHQTTARTGSRPPLPPVVPLLTLGVFLMITTEYIVAGMIQEIATDLRVTVARVGLLITAFAAGMIIGSPVMAMATRRFQARSTLLAALIAYAVGHVVAALTGSFAVVLVARFATALAAGAFWAVASAVATTAAGPANSTRALGVMMSGVGLATVAGVPLGSWAGQLLGWRGTFWALAVLAAVAAPVIWRFTPVVTQTQESSTTNDLRTVSTGRMFALVIATVLATGGYMTAFSYLSPLATGRAGLSQALVPLVFVVFGTGAIIGSNLAGRFADRKPLTTFLTATGGTVAFMGLLLPLSTNLVATLVLVLLLGMAGMAIPPVGTGLAVRFGAAAPALASALAVSAFNGGTAIGTWLGASALETSLGVLGPLVVAIGMAVLGLLALAIMGVLRLTSTEAGGRSTEASHAARG